MNFVVFILGFLRWLLPARRSFKLSLAVCVALWSLFTPNCPPLSAQVVDTNNHMTSGGVRWVSGEYVIKFNIDKLNLIIHSDPILSKLSSESLKLLAVYAIGATNEEELKIIGANLVKATSGVELDALTIVDLMDLGVIEYVSLNFVYKANVTPNDPSFSSLWGLNQLNDMDIDAPEAWDITTGSVANPVVVGVVDTGIDYTHPDLAENMWVNATEQNGAAGVDDDLNGVIDDIYGYNAISGSGDPLDDHKYSYNSSNEIIETNTYHGTHCAGTIGAVANNGIGVTGVAWNVKLMGLKFLSNVGYGTLTDAVKLIQYAILMKQSHGVNIRVLSNSWGGGSYTTALYDAIEAANNAGIVFVAAAGNEALNNDLVPHYPSSYANDNIISVAALSSSGTLASFSCYGATSVDVAAPGVNILSTKGGDTDSYHMLSGTSMATPHVSGVVALLLSQYPSYSPTDVKDVIISSITPIESLGGKMVGAGIVNAAVAVANTDNLPPVIAAIDNEEIAFGSTSVSVPFVASDPNEDTLTMSAHIVISEYDRQGVMFDEEYQFATYFPEYNNYYGYQEKHIESMSGGWYVIIPTGEIYEVLIDGADAWLEYIGQIHTRYYTQPLLLVNAYPSDESSYANVSISGSNIVIEPTEGFLGTFTVELVARDASRSVSETFDITVVERVPQISTISDQVVGHVSQLTIPFTANDPNDDVLSFSSQVEIVQNLSPSGSSVVTPADVSIAGGNLIITPDIRFIGTMRLTLTASDGVYDSSVQFLITITNYAPQIEDISDITIAQDDLYARAYYVVSDLDGDILTVQGSASDSSGNTHVGYVLSSANYVDVVPIGDFSGELFVQLSVSDGAETVVETFVVYVQAVDVSDPEPSDDTTPDDTIPDNVIPQNIDSDGDGVSDQEEQTEGTDPYDRGSFVPNLSSPIYTLWNGFLGMTNILELVNPNSTDMLVTVRLFTISGINVHTQRILIPANSQRDIIVNDMQGFESNSYGVLKLEFDGIIDGRLFFYRANVDGSFEFAFGVPLSNPTFGSSVVGFNTFQPSARSGDQDFVVANWLTIVNLTNEKQRYTINSYDQSGNLIKTREISLSAFGRTDIDGGHDFAGRSVVGLHEIIPQNNAAAYTAQIMRYGGNGSATVAPNQYSFAFPLIARAGVGQILYAPVSRQFGEVNWLEVANALNKKTSVDVVIRNKQGSVLVEHNLMIKAHAQVHINASDYLSEGETGSVTILPSESNSIVAQSMFYFRNTDGSIATMYGSQAKEAFDQMVFGSYNLYLNMDSWLKVTNGSDRASIVKCSVEADGGVRDYYLSLNAYGSEVIPIHDNAIFGAVSNSYGTVVLSSDDDAQFIAEIVRIRPLENTIDFAAPTVVR